MVGLLPMAAIMLRPRWPTLLVDTMVASLLPLLRLPSPMADTMLPLHPLCSWPPVASRTWAAMPAMAAMEAMAIAPLQLCRMVIWLPLHQRPL